MTIHATPDTWRCATCGEPPYALTPTERDIAAALVTHSNSEGVIDVGTRALMATSGHVEATVGKAIRSLRARGWLATERAAVARQTAAYRLTIPAYASADLRTVGRATGPMNEGVVSELARELRGMRRVLERLVTKS